MNYMMRFACLLSLTLVVTACGGRGGNAATLPNGNKIAVMVYFDASAATAAADADKVEQMQEVVGYMQPDLVAILQDEGYTAGTVADPNTPTGPGSYLLRVQILSYRGGSKAARMFVGYGAGAATLDTHFELIGPDNKSYVSGAPSSGTGRTDWRHLARKVNLETVDSIDARLHQSL